MNKSYKDGEMTVSTNIGIRHGESKVSMISELVKGLRELGNQMKRNDVAAYNLIFDAAYTIEALSEKVRANNLHEGWIPCSERLPEKHTRCLVTWESLFGTLEIDTAKYGRMWLSERKGDGWYIHGDEMDTDITDDVIAWMLLPEPYKEQTERSRR